MEDEETTEVVQEETQGISEETSPSESTGINPAWNDLLEAVPTAFHEKVTPYLQQWDKNYQEGIGKVHSQYEPYKPFIDEGYTPDQIQYGLQVLDMINNEPEKVYAAFQQYFEQQQTAETPVAKTEASQEQGQIAEPIDITQHPKFQELESTLTALAQYQVQQLQQQEEAKADSELEQEITSAKEKHGEFNEQWVLEKRIANPDLTMDQAVTAYKEFVKEILAQNNRPGPKVMGSGGQTPSQSTPVSELNDKDRRAVIVGMLKDRAAQGN